MNYDRALEYLRAGRMVYRLGWQTPVPAVDPKTQYRIPIAVKPTHWIKIVTIATPQQVADMELTDLVDHIVARMPDGTSSPWQCTSDEAKAQDWEVVPHDPEDPSHAAPVSQTASESDIQEDVTRVGDK